jgi:hypothetical protein
LPQYFLAKRGLLEPRELPIRTLMVKFNPSAGAQFKLANSLTIVMADYWAIPNHPDMMTRNSKQSHSSDIMIAPGTPRSRYSFQSENITVSPGHLRVF